MVLDPQLVAAWRRNRRRAASAVSSHRAALGLGAGLLLAAALWVLVLPHDPPCCYNDESSTAWNAWNIARNGHDEYGAHLPLYFRAFGEYRSPGQIYLMALLFKVLGPHLLLGRYLTRALMLAALLLVGLLAGRIAGRRWIGLAVAALGLTTPMLFEVSRLGTEAPLFDLPLAAFFAIVLWLARRERWPAAYGALAALPLAVLAYTYPAGRPLAPLLALALLVFLRRPRVAGIAAAWVTLAVLMAPIVVFMHRHPGALSGYAQELTWYDSSQLPFAAPLRLLGHLARNLNPVAVLVDGDPNLRHHVGPVGALLLPFWLLSWAGLAIVARHRRREPFWVYVALAQLALMIPASLTVDVLHTPRLVAAPIPGLLLCVPALEALGRLRLPLRRAAAAALVGVTALEAVLFGAAFVSDGAGRSRQETFQADFIPAFRAAEREGPRPIWLLDVASVHGLWQGVLDGVPRRDIVRWIRPGDTYAKELPPGDVVQFVPPPGTVALAGERCTHCRPVFLGPQYTTWIQR